MLGYFIRGHANACPVPLRCTCEPVLYLLTFLLISIAVAVETYIGLHYGVVTLTDAAHGGGDGLSDLFSILVALHLFPFINRELGNKVIAMLLSITIVGILVVTAHKVTTGYTLNPALIAFAGSVAFTVNALRAYMFYRSWELDPNPTRLGLAVHASTDALHSCVVTIIGVIGVVASFWISMDALRYADGVLSVLLCVYVGSMVPGVWSGHHDHKIFDLTLGRHPFFSKLHEHIHGSHHH